MEWLNCARRAVCGCIVLAVCASTGCEEKLVRGKVINDNEFAMYAAVTEADETHRVRVDCPGGDTWYREENAGLNLAHIELRRVYVAADRDGPSWYVLIPVKSDHYRALEAWSRERVDDHILFLYRGQPVGEPWALVHEVRADVTLRFKSEKRAKWLEAELRGYLR